MGSTWFSVVVDCADPVRLAELWCRVLGYRIVDQSDDIVDIAPDAEVARLLDLGARRIDVGQGPDASWVVLADPEDNAFCVLAPQAGWARPS